MAGSSSRQRKPSGDRATSYGPATGAFPSSASEAEVMPRDEQLTKLTKPLSARREQKPK
jgi:hypothetical protein